MHSIELKLGTYSNGHRQMKPIDFDKYEIYSFIFILFFYRSTEKKSYMLQPVELNYQKC